MVAVDAGKAQALALVADGDGQRLCPPVTFAMNRDGMAHLAARVRTAVEDRGVRLVRLGVEASGWHLPLLAPGALPCSWEVVELNPAHVAAQRKVNGQRGVKTDLVDATAMFDLLVVGRGSPAGTAETAVTELRAWAAFRARRVAWRRAVGNHLQAQLHRAFPRLVEAARQALPAPDAAVARQALAGDLGLLDDTEAQISVADQQLARLLPATPFAVLTTTPGWATIRAASYGAAIGDPTRWPSADKVYRASGLTPATYESSGRRVDGGISREGSTRWRCT